MQPAQFERSVEVRAADDGCLVGCGDRGPFLVTPIACGQRRKIHERRLRDLTAWADKLKRQLDYGSSRRAARSRAGAGLNFPVTQLHVAHGRALRPLNDSVSRIRIQTSALIHGDHAADAAAPGGGRLGVLTLYPSFLNTDCRFGCANCNPSRSGGPTAIPTQDEEDESRGE